jgi:uncharacterized protein
MSFMIACPSKQVNLFYRLPPIRWPGQEYCRVPDNNLDIIRTAYDAILRRDMVTALSFFEDEVEAHQSDLLPWGGAFSGKEQLLDFFTRMLGVIDPLLRIEEMFDAGGRVVVIGRTYGRVRVSNAPFDVRLVHIWCIRDDKIWKFDSYMDTSEMLKALD